LRINLCKNKYKPKSHINVLYTSILADLECNSCRIVSYRLCATPDPFKKRTRDYYKLLNAACGWIQILDWFTISAPAARPRRLILKCGSVPFSFSLHP